MWCRTPRAARSRRFIVSPAPFVLSDGGHENDALESLPRQHRDRFLRSIKILGNPFSKLRRALDDHGGSSGPFSIRPIKPCLVGAIAMLFVECTNKGYSLMSLMRMRDKSQLRNTLLVGQVLMLALYPATSARAQTAPVGAGFP